jgi:hypothetical protein
MGPTRGAGGVCGVPRDRLARQAAGQPALGLLRAGKLRGLRYLRLGRTYRFNLAEVDGWVKRQTAGGTLNGTRALR